MHIVFVDTSEEMREFYTRIASVMDDCIPNIFSTGSEAKRFLTGLKKTDKFTLVIGGALEDGQTGIELINTLEKKPQLQGSLLVIGSEIHQNSADKLSLIASGIDWVVKPLDAAELIVRIRRSLAPSVANR